jgi:glycosyltransferase involved in cell wall biosynthesis
MENSKILFPFSKAYPKNKGEVPSRQAIALISVHGDPATDIGKEEAGGQNIYVRQLGESLAKLGWQVDMFTRKQDENDPTIVQHSDHCRTIRLTAGPLSFIPRDELFPYLPEFVEAFLKFQAEEGIKYPLVHTNYWLSGWVGLELKRREKIQTVHTYHSVGAIKYQNILEPPTIAHTRLATEQRILTEGDRVVATSPQEKEHLRSFVAKKGAIDIIPCGVNLQTFHQMSKIEARSILGLDPQAAIVLYVGRFDPRKGIETLVKAFAQVKEKTTANSPRLIIVGGSDPQRADGQEKEIIANLVQSLEIGSHTEFVGQVGHDRLPLYYTAADVCVVPSHYEPFGLVAIEAMACGTPVIASNVGGLKFTVVPGETGYLVPPKNVEAFADSIDRVLSNSLSGGMMGKQAAERVQEKFSWTGVAINLSNLYRQLLADSLTRSYKSASVSAITNSTLEKYNSAKSI